MHTQSNDACMILQVYFNVRELFERDTLAIKIKLTAIILSYKVYMIDINVLMFP